MDESPAERGGRSLTEQDVRALVAALNEIRSVPYELHLEHHDYISALIVREQKRAELYEKLKAHVLGWGIVGIVTGLGYALLSWFRDHMK